MTNETLRDKIAQYLDEKFPEYDAASTYQAADAILALPETAGWTALEAATDSLANSEDRIDELEAKLAKAICGLQECEQEIDDYIRQEYPHDHPVQERYRQRDLSANPARATLAELKQE